MKIKKKKLKLILDEWEKTLNLLDKYQASGLTPEECQKLGESKRAGLLFVLPDLSRISRNMLSHELLCMIRKAAERNTYGGGAPGFIELFAQIASENLLAVDACTIDLKDMRQGKEGRRGYETR